MNNLEEWITVTKKKTEIKFNQQTKKTFDEIKNIILNIILKYKPSYIFIYGSRARKTNKINSDVDIMVFWKYPYPCIEELIDYKNELKSALQLDIDFVNMKLINKLVIIMEEQTKCYYNNIILDAICIYSKNKKILSELIDYSIKMQKI
jgi:predicted nucleotidyltransferase